MTGTAGFIDIPAVAPGAEVIGVVVLSVALGLEGFVGNNIWTPKIRATDKANANKNRLLSMINYVVYGTGSNPPGRKG
jgi:hypothetical protein